MDNSGKKRPKEENFKGSTGERFSSEKQPSGEQKSAGWAKKKVGTELAKLILDLPFKGKLDGVLRKDIASYFGVDENHITNEQVIYFRQIEKAVSKSDTPAAKFVIERAHGSPTQSVDFGGNSFVLTVNSQSDTTKKILQGNE